MNEPKVSLYIKDIIELGELYGKIRFPLGTTFSVQKQFWEHMCIGMLHTMVGSHHPTAAHFLLENDVLVLITSRVRQVLCIFLNRVLYARLHKPFWE